jgi:hypothetical protein
VIAAAIARPLESEERVRHGAQRDVVMKASPGSAFEVVQADFALHVLVVALAPPTTRVHGAYAVLVRSIISSAAIW